MTFLLDTNVVSEWVKPRPDPGVVSWLADVDEDRVFISVITLAELRHGIERMGDGAVAVDSMNDFVTELPERFEGRVLLIDDAVADAWGRLVADRETAGRRIGPMDAFIAATAQVHELSVVTRNTADFKSSVHGVVNPWRED